jgi:hypothetical protein
MASVGEQLVQAMSDALNNGTSPPCTCFRTRIDAFATKELPAFVIYAVHEKPETRGPGTKLRKRTVRLEAMVAGEPPADSLVDPLYVYAINTLLADANLRQYIRRLEESQVQWETEASYQDACIAAIDFEIAFVTTNDPTVRVDA